MLKRLRKAHPILHSLLAEVLFLGPVFLLSGLVSLVLSALGINTAGVDEYLIGSVQELVALAVAVLILAASGRLELLRKRGCGFFNGLLVGMYPVVVIGQSFSTTMMFYRPEMPLKPVWQILFFLLNMILVGVSEELLFRGVVAQTLLEHYGTSRKGIWTACLMSGVLFGSAHLINLLAAEPFGVLMQCLFAASLGMLLTAIYYRTGNLWVTVFLHAAMDITALLVNGLYGTATAAESIGSYDITTLITVAVYLVPTAYLLRKSRLDEVRLYWSTEATK